MEDKPTEKQLQLALTAAGAAHGEYEQNALGGIRDDQWPGWYAAYVLGRLGDFTAPTALAHWLESVPADLPDWYVAAGTLVAQKLRGAIDE